MNKFAAISYWLFAKQNPNIPLWWITVPVRIQCFSCDFVKRVLLCCTGNPRRKIDFIWCSFVIFKSSPLTYIYFYEQNGLSLNMNLDQRCRYAMRTGSAFSTGNGNARRGHYGLRSFTTDFVHFSCITFSVLTFSAFRKKEKYVCIMSITILLLWSIGSWQCHFRSKL